MLTPQEKQQLSKQIDALSQEINELRTRFRELDDQKEELFSSRTTLGRQISSFIKEIRALKTERNTLTDSVKKAKEQRTTLSETLKQKIGEHRKVIIDKKEAQPKKGITVNPGFIKKKIEELEHHLETEVIDFSKEQKIMKTLRELKKKRTEALKAGAAFEHSGIVNKEITQLKKQADDFHATIQNQAHQSQNKHEAMLKLWTQVDLLKKKEGEIETQIDAKRAALQPLSQQLTDKNKHLAELRSKLHDERKARDAQNEQKRKRTLAERQHDVMEKLRKKEKLTTEDLIVIQSIEEPELKK